jgi:glutamate-1-semialdehyde 2,1-aminomutase
MRGVHTESAQRVVVRSQAIFKSALGLIPGGTSMPLSCSDADGRTPLYIVKASGCGVTDVDGHDYIDYTCGRGMVLLAHGDQRVVVAVDKASSKGLSDGLPIESEVRLAELIIARIRGVEMVSLVGSAMEALLLAIRTARRHTGRSEVIRFAGCHDGTVDMLTSASAVLPFNDLNAVKQQFTRHRGKIAAVVVEPTPSRMGLVPAADGYLAGLREICHKREALLIFDESATAFRAGPGGASDRLGVIPDLAVLGSIIGGGLTLGALGGRRDLMQSIASSEHVGERILLGGNPLAIAAGIATLQATAEEGFYEALDAAAAKLEEGLRAAAAAAAIPVRIHRVGSLLSVFFTDTDVVDWTTAQTSDTSRYARWRAALLERGVLIPPSPHECLFLCAAHGEEHIARTVAAAAEAFNTL